MKIACVLGSPRANANSTLIASHFLHSAESCGAETRAFTLAKLHYRGCQACHLCKTARDTCVLKDDVAPILEAIRDADVFVLATPVYIQDIPGQVKCFIDRTFSYYKPGFHADPQPSRLPFGKKLVFIITQAKSDEGMHTDVFARYSDYLTRALNLAEVHLIRVCGVGVDGAFGVPEQFLRQAEETARTLSETASGRHREVAPPTLRPKNPSSTEEKGGCTHEAQ
jgi:multimeric flavodoxin WrbA